MAVLLLLGSGVTAHAQVVGAEDGFAAHIAQERSSRGISALTPAADLQAVARRQAQRMADRGEPYHNPDLGSEVHGWSIVAENVGVGPDVTTVHQAFMDSSTHRDIILNPDVTELGVGVVQTSDGQLWVVEVFRRPEASSPGTAPTRPPTTAGAGPTVAQVTTIAPPTTTTTTIASPPAPEPAAASPLPRVSADGEALASTGARPATLGRFAIDASAPVAIAPDLAGIARRVSPAAWVAAFLLAGVVGLQGQALRRLGLVG